MKKLITLASILAVSASGFAFAKSGESAQALEQATITASQAIDIASAKASGTVTSVDFDYKQKTQTGVYEVDFKNGNEKQEIRIDAKTGEIIGTKTEKTDKTLAAQPTVTLKQAIETAQSKEAGKVKKADLKTKNGQTVYKVEIKNGTQEKDVIIDATSGQMLDVRADN